VSPARPAWKSFGYENAGNSILCGHPQNQPA
jgi:hypothetical protein